MIPDNQVAKEIESKSMHAGGWIPPDINLFWIRPSPECTTKVQYKFDHTSKTKNRTKKTQKSVSEHCASFGLIEKNHFLGCIEIFKINRIPKAKNRKIYFENCSFWGGGVGGGLHVGNMEKPHPWGYFLPLPSPSKVAIFTWKMPTVLNRMKNQFADFYFFELWLAVITIFDDTWISKWDIIYFKFKIPSEENLIQQR